MIETEKSIWPGWETVRLIGRGNFGAVYEIQRNILGDVERAALKVISIPQNDSDIEELYSDGYDDESLTNTFHEHLKNIISEYSLMRKMNGCSNIVSCDDVRYIQHNDGIGWDIFIKMELLTPLTKALSGNVSEDTVIKIAKDMCIALELCKKHGIIHRDIKPQNVFVSPNGDYKLGDFGIAKTVEKTTGGTKIGTYKYMAPEVYHYQPYGYTADIYSLGLVLYWLLNERRMPFMPLPPAKLRASSEEQARDRRLSGEALPEPANGSKQLKAIVLRACSYRPEERYKTGAEMLAALNSLPEKQGAVSAGENILPKKDSLREKTPTAANLYREEDAAEISTTEQDQKIVDDIAVSPSFEIMIEQTEIADITKEKTVQICADGSEKKEDTIQNSDPVCVVLPDGSWKCVCGRINAAYVSSCVCKASKHKLMLIYEKPSNVQHRSASNGKSRAQDPWKCSCGRINAAYVSSCVCGASKWAVVNRNNINSKQT